MGWTFGYDLQSKADLVKERTEGWTNEHTRISAKCLCHSVKGNVLWTVWEISKPDGLTERFIGCDLLSKHKDVGWGYKDMSESMGPYYYTCPLSYLDMVPVASEEWRQHVRAHHARLRRTFQIGQIVRLAHRTPNTMEIVSVKPLLGRHAGRLYRVPRSAVVDDLESAV